MTIHPEAGRYPEHCGVDGGSLAPSTLFWAGADQQLRHGYDARLAGPTDSVAYHAGISWRLGNGTLYGIYNYAKDDGRSPWVTEDAKASHYGVAYFYDFSRRTQLYAAAAFMDNSGSARMSTSSAGYTTGWTTAAGEDARALQLGMRHSF